MSRETIILIGFCVFAFLFGLRLKKYFGGKKQTEEEQQPIKKNQRSKMAKAGQEPNRYSRSKRKKTIRLFTIFALVIMIGLMIYMTPALVRDIQRADNVDFTNLILRMLVFGLAILIFVTGYVKLAKQKKKED